MPRSSSRRIGYVFLLCILIATITYNGYGRWHKAELNRFLKAAGTGDRATVRSLLRWGFSPNENERPPEGWWSSPAVMAAASHGQIEMLKLLLDHGGDANVRDSFGNTALSVAVQQAQYGSVQLLLQHGANVNAPASLSVSQPDTSSPTALMLAAEMGDIALCRLLLQHGADVHARDNRGRTALLYAAGYSDSLTRILQHNNSRDAARYSVILSLLLQRGAKTDVMDSDGKTALMLAATSNLPATTLLLGHGAPVKTTDKDGVTALMYAALAGCAPIVQALLHHGADPNRKDRDGKTALMRCLEVLRNSGEIHAVVDQLLGGGADVNIRDLRGRTVLQYAIYAGDLAVVQALIAHGVDMHTHGDRNDTPLQTARNVHQTRIAALLQQAGAKE